MTPFDPARVVASAAALILLMGDSAMAQVLTNTSNGVLSASIPFGTLTPGTSSTPSSTQIQFRIRSNKNNGYKVQATASFAAVNTSSPDGGSTVSAADIGVGITSLALAANVLTPRTDTITAGFNYNPATVSAVNGMTPYTGIASGRATLADILASPNITILAGPRIGNNQNVGGAGNFITVTVTFGLLGQFFTPATLSGILTLTIANGP
jgi:hypothetical protein